MTVTYGYEASVKIRSLPEAVRYTYKEEKKESAMPEITLTPDMLAELPEELKQALREAAYNLDISTTDEVIGRIRTNYPHIAEGLQVLAKEFSFDRILLMLDELRKNND